MEFHLRHANVQTTDKARVQKNTVRETVVGGDVVTFNEANDIESVLPRELGWHWQGDNAVGWRRDKAQCLHRGSRLIMKGGYVTRVLRLGPDRYIIWVVLEFTNGFKLLVGVTHTVAKASTDNKWRQSYLWASLKIAGQVLKRKARRYNVDGVILVGDLNWPNYVSIEGLEPVETPPTYGRRHYDQVHVSGVKAKRVKEFRTGSDHDALDITFVA